MIPTNYINLFRSIPGLMPTVSMINPLGSSILGGPRVSFIANPGPNVQVITDQNMS